ncbi:fibronectin type III domain-containing protein [Modestobacter sp. L9-4]|uniref:fibronectin type III domain-containing protein n=1 Tax=Modestobacter sp. L9-4 TaxID=2851567 RepID=UPI001C77F849|nr:fibronectin type III domain-containing protein [Modestobacter sp. L9-4]QXG74586.1 fibronectin type III domain-containing protein [Modestobacter sp. L9-4]
MRFSSPTRRAAGLLAVTTIGLSTAVLSVTGVASAADPVPTPFVPDGDFYTVTTMTGPGAEAEVTGAEGFTVPAGYCRVVWDIDGAAGGATPSAFGGKGGSFSAATAVTANQVFTFTTGTNGGETKAGEPVRDEQGELTTDEGGAVVMGPDTAGAAGLPGGQPGSVEGGFVGGGGGLTTVSLDGAVLFSAFGGDGSDTDPDGTDAGAGAGDEQNVVSATATDVKPYDDSSGSSIRAWVQPCDAPPLIDPDAGNPPAGSDPGPTDPDDGYEYVTGAPTANWVSGVDNGLMFQLYVSTLDSENPVTGVEYTLDGGATWKPVATENEGDYQYSGTITGLETATRYSVAFRFTTATGHTDASETLTGRTAVPGPRDVKAVAGAASIKVSWTPPASTDEVAGYLVIGAPEGAQNDSGSIECRPTTALGTSCAMSAVPGTTYSLSVHSLAADGDKLGSSDWVTVGPVLASSAVSATLPKADGTLTSSDADGKVVAGEQVTISGKDFLPGSVVDLVVYSTPVKLGTATVLADGTFSATVTLPKDLANGTHHLVASGVDVNGDPRTLIVEVTVSGGTAVLAFTGFSALPYAGAGALALLAGGGLLVVSRRRQAA